VRQRDLTVRPSRRPGAVPAAPPDEEVAAHYGDPAREQRSLFESAALVDRSNRGVLRVSGPDRLSWLHSVTSQHLADLPPWQSTEGLVLSPHGHVEHHFVLTDDGSACWLDVEPRTADALLAYLTSMVFMLRVQPVDATADWAVLSLLGPAAAAACPQLAGLSPGGCAALPGGGFVRRVQLPAPFAADLVVPRDRVENLVDELRVPLAGLDAYEAARVVTRLPRLGRETDHRTIPHEVGWIGRAVHLDKGCYRGQETVARVHNLGRPPRRLVFLHLDGSPGTLPATGDPVELDGRAVGFVTTAVRHYELGPVSLALVKRSTPDDAALLAGGVPAKIES
jgi:folate-binding protein YgfZ